RGQVVPTSPSDWKQLFAAWAITIVSAAGVVWLLVVPLVDVARVKTWRPTPCRIVASTIRQEHIIGGEVHFTAYRADVLYAYTVGDVEYRSNALRPGERGSPWYYSKRAITEKFPAGATTSCYVNPTNPSEAVLVRSAAPAVLYGLYPLALGAMGVAGVVTQIRHRHNPRD